MAANPANPFDPAAGITVRQVAADLVRLGHAPEGVITGVGDPAINKAWQNTIARFVGETINRHREMTFGPPDYTNIRDSVVTAFESNPSAVAAEVEGTLTNKIANGMPMSEELNDEIQRSIRARSGEVAPMKGTEYAENLAPHKEAMKEGETRREVSRAQQAKGTVSVPETMEAYNAPGGGAEVSEGRVQGSRTRGAGQRGRAEAVGQSRFTDLPGTTHLTVAGLSKEQQLAAKDSIGRDAIGDFDDLMRNRSDRFDITKAGPGGAGAPPMVVAGSDFDLDPNYDTDTPGNAQRPENGAFSRTNTVPGKNSPDLPDIATSNPDVVNGLWKEMADLDAAADAGTISQADYVSERSRIVADLDAHQSSLATGPRSGGASARNPAAQPPAKPLRGGPANLIGGVADSTMDDLATKAANLDDVGHIRPAAAIGGTLLGLGGLAAANWLADKAFGPATDTLTDPTKPRGR
jgi:hypothetical protein